MSDIGFSFQEPFWCDIKRKTDPFSGSIPASLSSPQIIVHFDFLIVINPHNFCQWTDFFITHEFFSNSISWPFSSFIYSFQSNSLGRQWDFFLIKIVKEESLEGVYRIVSLPVLPLAKFKISKSYYVLQWASGYLRDWVHLIFMTAPQ